ncbi:MAG: LysE family translocator [Pseudomonadota bacterium]
MEYELLSALAVFAFVSSATPGPNNLMLLASGANFGVRRTVPHMLGISVGHAVMVLLLGLGLAGVFTEWPAARLVLSVLSVVYMVWLAWKIAHAAAPGEPAAAEGGTEAGRQAGRPLTFLQAAAFQWVNPKAWAMALTAVTVYAPGTGMAAMALVAVVFASVNLPSVSIWTCMGVQVRHFLTSARRLQVFNWTMALLLLASLWPVLAL